jgi:HK97 gp10 family phage protein
MAPKFTNVKTLTEKINAIGKNTGVEVMKALQQGGLAIENTATEGIINPPKTGRIYPSKYRKGAMHQASAPGEFPAADSGRLHQSLTTAPVENGPQRFVVQTGANTPYATHLELGTAKMAPRPFMGPAFDENLEKNKTRIRNAVARAARSK